MTSVMESPRTQISPIAPKISFMTIDPEISNIVLTASLTLIGGIIIFCSQNLFVTLFLKPFDEFKREKGKVKYLLLLNKQIYTNGFESATLQPELKERIITAQFSLRKQWARLFVKYDNLILKCFVPKEEDMAIVYEDLIYISNSPIIIMSPNSSRPDCLTVQEKISHALAILS